MARYFHFRTLQDVQQAALQLGAEVVVQEDLSPLWQPITVGPFRVGNRLCIQPMEGCDGTPEGAPGELTLRRYQRFGAGGAKLIWGEATAVLPEARANPRQLCLTPQTAPALAHLLETCRQAHRQVWGSDSDLLVGLQLTHSGRYSHFRPLLVMHDPLLDPLTFDRSTGRYINSDYPLLSDDDLLRILDAFIAAARLAWQIGFQFVDIKQCHRYLLNELLAARLRPGRFGGSLENRTQLVRLMIQRLRQEVPGLLIFTRLNVYDGVPYRAPPHAPQSPGEPWPFHTPVLTSWGTSTEDPLQPDLTEPLRWIAEMRQLGVSAVNVSMGNPYASPHLTRPFEYPPPDGYEPPEPPLLGVARHFRLTEMVQRTFPDLLVVGSGYSYLQEFAFHAAAANLAQGRVSVVGVGRAALAQPDFVLQLRQHGRLERRRVCRTFSYCTALMRSKHHPLGQFPTGCPPFDKEVYGPIWQQAQSR
ncbi:MAG: NADH:flavin oxidoreductase [Gemmatales bacterium]|nr:NADH:flavin oxidoreductase [Gemmatales bacterium]MDW8222969.1 NADH:flavin oxidoreductase [Gemmatales bacterium]